MRRVRRLCVAAALVLAGSAYLVTPGARAAGPSPVPPPAGYIYDGVAAAAAVHEQFDAVGGFAAVSEPQYDNVPDALTVFNSDLPTARASTYYPGATVADFGPGVLCGQVIEPNIPPLAPLCPSVPPFPTVAQAPTPSGSPDNATTGGQDLSSGPLGVTAIQATAHADHTYVNASATDGRFGTAGTAGPDVASAVLDFRRAVALATAGPIAAAGVRPEAADSEVASDTSSSAVSHQSFDDKRELVVTATSTVHGAKLLGGAIGISSVVATSSFVNDGLHVKRHDQSVTVSGVTAGGMPATIDQNGVTVNGSGTGKPAIDAVNAALQNLLKATQTSIRLLTPSTSSKPTPAGLDAPSLGAACTNGEADGVQLYQQANATQVPQGQIYYVSVTMGSACTDATVSPGGATLPSAATPGVPLPSTGVGPAVGTAPTPVGSTGPLGPSGSTGSGAASAAGPLPLAAGPAASAAPSTASGVGGVGRLAASLVRDPTGRFSLLYLALVIGFVGLALGVIPLLAPRLPHH